MKGLVLVRKPDYLSDDIQTVDEGVYQPHSMSRRSEIYAYGFMLSVGLATWFLRTQTGKLSLTGVFITGLFLIVGLVLSFGAWMESGTRINASAKILTYKNPLRSFQIPWENVARIHARWVRERWKIIVFSDDAGMIFNTEFPDEKPGLVSPGSDFINGPMLAVLIRSRAKLSEPFWGEDDWICEKTEVEQG